MDALYFFSGFDNVKGFTAGIGHSLREHIRDRKSLAILASCPYDHERTDLYSSTTIRWFHDIGIEFERVIVVDDRKSEAECIDLITGASAVFLSGGSTLLQFDFVQKNNLIPVFMQFDGVIMGMSAGAINMAINSFYAAHDEHEITHIFKGIGLADVSMRPHFSIDNVELLNNVILPFSEIIDIYCVCDNGAIIVSDGKQQYHGEIYLASKGNVERVSVAAIPAYHPSVSR